MSTGTITVGRFPGVTGILDMSITSAARRASRVRVTATVQAEGKRTQRLTQRLK
jgi:hypothetical protein